MRLFVAADISEETRAQIRAIREQLTAQFVEARDAPRVTWVKDEGAHVTLRFIGEVSDERAAAIQTVLLSDVVLEPFDVRWDRLGTFPGGRSPRVIWIGATSGGGGLAELARQVEDRLTPVVGPGETRPFKAHLTVGRVKEPGRFIWPEALSRVTLEPTMTHVDHITLYRSRLSPKGPTYSSILRAGLRQ